MALVTEKNPPGPRRPGALRIRFHSVGGYGTVATGKLLTDLLSSLMGMHSKSAPKYGSEKSGASTNYYITLSPEPVLITNAELEDVEVVVAPDHQVFSHTNPLKGLVAGGTLIMQSDRQPIDVWRELPAFARRTISERGIRFLVLDAFAVARAHAPNPELETRMMGIAFIGAIIGHVDGAARGGTAEEIEAEVRAELTKKFGRRGERVVEANVAVIRDGMRAIRVDYTDPAFAAVEADPILAGVRAALSVAMTPSVTQERNSGLFDPGYFEEILGRPLREGTLDDAPIVPGTGPVHAGRHRCDQEQGHLPPHPPGLRRRPRAPPAWSARSPAPTTPSPTPATSSATCSAQRSTPPACAERDRSAPATASSPAGRTGSGGSCASSPASPTWPPSQARPQRCLPARAGGIGATRTPCSPPSPPSRPRGRVRCSTQRRRPRAAPACMFSAVIDPWKCTGCLQCIEVCGPKALTSAEQDDDLLSMLETRFERLTKLPGHARARHRRGHRTRRRHQAHPAEPQRLLLDDRRPRRLPRLRRGHRDPPGQRAHPPDRREPPHGAPARPRRPARPARGRCCRHPAGGQPAPATRIEASVAELERRLYLYESGPTGNGPAPTVIANSTGCSSVYASTVPFTPYLDPWVNGLFQDAQPLAVGIYEGLVSGLVAEVRALRTRSPRTGRHVRPCRPRCRAVDPVVARLHPGGARAGAGRAHHQRRRRGLRHRLRRAVARPRRWHPDQVPRPRHRRLLQHRRPGLDGQLRRPGRRPRPVRQPPTPASRRPARNSGLLAAFHPGTYVCATASVVPRALPAGDRRHARVQLRRGADGDPHPVRHRERHAGGPGQRPLADGRGQPDEPAVRARPAHAATPLPSGSASRATPSPRTCGRRRR